MRSDVARVRTSSRLVRVVGRWTIQRAAFIGFIGRPEVDAAGHTQIRTGELKPGDKLPSISELCAQYGVSTQVIRSAMLILRAEGLVEGHQGRGVYVRDQGSHPSH
ncbi:GntR family transcriptional regulator [Micromonospora terminaliae]|uniref:GntR family transcriptional regulator n=2 Tax=Micromonospora terminaliae TaxID=1914461 RepID=A0AAJ3DM22_9ACTN|nr:winged helix-turn-helix transcriptional regulator [Micromonospora terminaliae]QGL49714.1 GntR family transcriptional regulator [Micromonospora terminaliae]